MTLNAMYTSIPNPIDDNFRRLIRDDIREDASPNRRFLIMNGLAAVVASYGLLTDNTATVIGAMVIATYLGAISGIALALVDGDLKLLRRSLSAALAGIGLVVLVAVLIGTIHPHLPITEEILARTNPTLPDLLIALAGGAAGAYATVSPRISAGLVGVAIAASIVPPLAACGICLARGELELAGGAMELFLANVTAIQISYSVTLWLFGFHQIGRASGTFRQIVRRNALSLLLLVLLCSALAVNFYRSVGTQLYEARVRQLVADFAREHSMDLLELDFSNRERNATTVTATFGTRTPLDAATIDTLEARLPRPRGERTELDARFIIVDEVRTGPREAADL